MNTQHIPAFIVAVVAVNGAVLSTLTFVARWRAKRPAVKVTVSNGFFTYPAVCRPANLMLRLSAANTGEQPVTLSSFGQAAG